MVAHVAVSQLTGAAVPVENYGAHDDANGDADGGENGDNNNVAFVAVADDDSSSSGSASNITGGERSFRDSKALPNVIATLNADNVWLSTRGAVTALGMLDRTESGEFLGGDDRESKYRVIPSLTEARVALVCDSNLTRRDQGTLYYDETSFYNVDVVPRFVVTVNPYIFQNIMREVWHSTTVPCGMYFCCQGGDGAHTGEAHEDFVSIELAYLAVGLVFLFMLVLSIMPGDEEWGT